MEQNYTIMADDEEEESEKSAAQFKYGTISKDDSVKWQLWMEENHPNWLAGFT